MDDRVFPAWDDMTEEQKEEFRAWCLERAARGIGEGDPFGWEEQEGLPNPPPAR